VSEADVRKGVLDIIRQMKPEGLSELDAAINVISNHAATIREQAARIAKLEGIIERAAEEARKP
jgi:hypothetical protein